MFLFEKRSVYLFERSRAIEKKGIGGERERDLKQTPEVAATARSGSGPNKVQGTLARPPTRAAEAQLPGQSSVYPVPFQAQ